ncbi:hypothetical protein F511_07496 [Dorcoceras hygrometricum]|uniref:Reverse transcriptase domain-containing protein n=1 Tax=Dorcoceras hygrometricum TaxID=472368 RepID=A0A2Z7AX95_9LAMI|nr:hypothetical protein F511_07496 [Dorcoceras hygrometricum]
MQESAKRQSSDKYCKFHKDKGHTTEDCYSLRAEIEKFIKRGYLENFVDESHGQKRSGEHQNEHPRRDHAKGRDNIVKQAEKDENLPTGGVIAVINGGPTCGD